jgi:RimJ/RimL family protein N-acetyltransferase
MLTETMRPSQTKLALTMRRPWAIRIARGLLWRLARRTRVMVLRAPRNDFGPSCPEGCALVRIAGAASAADHDLAEEVMRAAGEPNGLVAPRLAHGDEFFGWLADGRVVSFGWVTCQDRTVGPFQFAEVSGRTFLYNFHTLEAYRGRGLYPALLLAMRHVLGREKVTEFVIDVNAHNTASARGIEKGGFVLVARVAFLTLFTRWRCLGSRTVLERTASPLFRTA